MIKISDHRWLDAGHYSSHWVLEESSEGVIELGQRLYVERETRTPIMCDWIQDQPGQGIVALQYITETQTL